MEKHIINPPSLATPSGFNHGISVRGGQMLFLAGQDSSGPDGQIVGPGDLLAQCAQVLDNLRTVVEAAGGTMEHIVKLNIYVISVRDYRAQLKPLGKLFREYFGTYYPAMALFEVSSLFKDQALIEMEGFAVVPDAQG